MQESEHREKMIKDSYKKLIKMIQSGEKVEKNEVDELLMSSHAGSQLLHNYENQTTGIDPRYSVNFDESMDGSKVVFFSHKKLI